MGVRPAQIRNWQQVSPNDVLPASDKYRRYGVALRQLDLPQHLLPAWRSYLEERHFPHLLASGRGLTPVLCPSGVRCGKDMPAWF